MRLFRESKIDEVKILSPQIRKKVAAEVMRKLEVSERKACSVLGLNRTTQRYKSKKSDDEAVLREAIVRLASKYGRYGYRRIAAMLKSEGWKVNHKRVERIWREEGISDYTYYRWRREYGGLNIDQAKELKNLKQENEKLKKAVAELTLDKLILNEALSGKY